MSEENFISSLRLELVNEKIENSQIEAWKATLDIFKKITKTNEIFFDTEFIFEYKIPFSDGKRPDVLMFIKDTLYIIEFKNRHIYHPNDLIQLLEYKNLIKYYHSESYNYILKPLLLFNSNNDKIEILDRLITVSKKSFIKEWGKFRLSKITPTLPVSVFEDGEYKPNLDIINYAESIYLDDHMTGIKHSIIEESQATQEKIHEIIGETKKQNQHSLIFILGEAGSGKSALALKLSKIYNAPLVTKNNKFINLIRKRLNHKVNLHSSTAVIREFCEKRSILKDKIVIVDEAQRVWDNRRIKSYYGDEFSEYFILLQHIKKNTDWSATIIFIGIDQQLASSETSYFEKWPEALNSLYLNKNKVKIFQPYNLDLGKNNYENIRVKEFQLNNSIRNNIEEKYSKLINDIIENPIANYLNKSVNHYLKQGFNLSITRDINKAISYINSHSNRRKISSALIGTPNSNSDKAKGLKIDYQSSKKVELEQIFNPKKETNLQNISQNALTQFDVLGLEFDIPIVQWSDDYLFYDNQWNYDFISRIEGYGMFYTRNAYRVLLTRGRKGMILYFPQEWVFNKTYTYFKNLGFNEIK